MQKYAKTFLYIILVLFLIAIASVFIGQGSIGLSRLFQGARILPPNAEFAQLMAISVFVGWSLNRIIRRFGGK
jgi:hypothetical protein